MNKYLILAAVCLLGTPTIALANDEAEFIMPIQKRVDLNGDSVVTQSEYNADNLGYFEKMDADDNENITLKEYKNYYKSLGRVPRRARKMQEKHFEIADENEDGLMTFDEFMKLGYENFFKYDFNKDGKLTAKEANEGKLLEFKEMCLKVRTPEECKSLKVEKVQ